MRFSRSIPDRFKSVLMKELPGSVQDKIKTASRFLEITEDAVIHTIVTDWVAREAAEIKLFRKRTTSNVSPFQFDNFRRILLGDDLFSLLKAEHMVELTSHDASTETHEQYLEKIREKIRKSETAITKKIGDLLQWTYEHTDLVKTPAHDKTLSNMIARYYRAGFSEDQLKKLLVDETTYL